MWNLLRGGRCANRRDLRFPQALEVAEQARYLYAAKTAELVISAPVSVITSGQARHAVSPACKCHRHCGRMEHSGSTKGSSLGAAVRSSCSSMMRSTMPHLPSVHWTQAARVQVLLKRNRFSGERPCRVFNQSAKLGRTSGYPPPTVQALRAQRNGRHGAFPSSAGYCIRARPSAWEVTGLRASENAQSRTGL